LRIAGSQYAQHYKEPKGPEDKTDFFALLVEINTLHKDILKKKINVE
jgi:hypothetical protein